MKLYISDVFLKMYISVGTNGFGSESHRQEVRIFSVHIVGFNKCYEINK